MSLESHPNTTNSTCQSASQISAKLLQGISLSLLCSASLHATNPKENLAQSFAQLDSAVPPESTIPAEPPKVRKHSHKALDPKTLDSNAYVESNPKKQWLFGDILHPYVAMGLVSASSNATNVRQSMSKEVATCPDQLCTGDTTSASYQGMLDSGMSLELGAEYFFDRFHIIGVRLFGEMSQRNGSLGSKIQGSDKRDRSSNNLQQAYALCIQNSKTWNAEEAGRRCGILILGNSTDPNTPNTKVEDSFTFQKTPDAAQIAPQDGKYLSFALGIDALLNLPIDYALKRWAGFYLGDGFFASRLTYIKLGVFVGGGAEFARFSQGDPQNKTWQNTAAAQGKASNLNDAFFAAGSGGFLRYGVSVYLTRFARLSFGYKHSYYPIAQERWYGYNGAKFDTSKPDNIGEVRPDDPWSETLLRQRYVSTKGEEWFLQFALSF